MTSVREAEELVGKAERGEWSLECDGKVLELMQNVANKIEARSAATKSNIDRMMLDLDETKVKLSNLTRINSIKNTKFCENLIRPDHLDLDSKNDEVPKEAVKLSPQIAIENGLKLMEHCFEKHRVNLDPSSSGSQTSTVYRPIDKYMNVLPHLIGSEKWKHQWHVGLIAEPTVHPNEPQQRNESVNPSAETSSARRTSITSTLDRTSLMASQDSLAKSVSSVDDRTITNREMFTDDDDNISSNSLVVPNTSRFFQEQIEHRRIVNLFDDEPPSLSHSPVLGREPINLFEDNVSEDSIAIAVTSETNQKFREQKSQFQQPVDLFNDNEFDDFIKKIEERPENRKPDVAATVEVKTPAATKTLQGNIQNILGNVIADVKAVHSKQREPVPQTVQTSKTTTVKTEKDKPDAKLRATNLFDDDDQDDYFNEIIKQKSVKASQPVAQIPTVVPVKSKFTSLFDDDDEDGESFDDIFKKKSLQKIPVPQASSIKTKSSLFDDDDEEPLASASKQDSNVKVHKEENLTEVLPKTFPTAEKKIIPEKSKVDEVSQKPHEAPKAEQKIIPEIEKVEEVPGKPADASEEPKIAPVEVAAEKQPDEIPEKPSLQSSLELFDEAESSSTKQELQQEDESAEKVVEEAGSTMEDITITLPEDTPPDVGKTFEDQIDNEWVDEPLPQTPERSRNPTLPFLSDEPPEDDESAWTTEDNFDDSELFFSPSSNDYSSVPLFDEVPPEDDAFIIPSTLKPSPSIAPSIVKPSEASDQELNFDQRKQEKSMSQDEPDRSAIVGAIKSKMDIFNRKADEISSLPPIKKSLPGKLNSNLKINVGALMPGARPSRDATETLDDPSKDDAPDESSSRAARMPVKSPQQEETETSLLNNDVTKSRARIQTKRRPSTRRGRKSIYEKSSLDGEAGDADPEKLNDTSASNSATTISASVFDAPETTSNVVQEKISAKIEKKTVTTNKISVFYDDEDDTRLLVEQRRQEEKEQKALKKDTASLFEDDGEDDFFGTSSAPKKTLQAAPTKVSKDVKTAHYDESDEDLFVPIATKTPTKTVSDSSVKASKSLFDDDGDDDLFASIAKKSNPIAKNTSKVQTSASSGSTKAVSKALQSKSSSLFGDDDDDDDDLFNSKPKSSSKSSTKFQSSLAKTQKTRTDHATKADDDPLKDLFNK